MTRSPGKQRRRPALPRRRGDRAWTRLVEDASLSRSPGDLSHARAVFDALPETERRRLARELVATRAGELVRAYPDVVSVSAGFRIRKDRTRSPDVQRDVCVTLIVKRKLPRASLPKARRLPKALFTYCRVGSERVLCAISTDIEDAGRLRRIRPLLPIEAIAAGQPSSAPGMIACAVARGGGVYAVSCRHVYGMALMPNPPTLDEPEVRKVGDIASFARATKFAGPLKNGLEFSFDGQLAEVLDADPLRAILRDVTYASRALGWDDLHPGEDAWIVTARGPILARFAKQHFDPVEYSRRLNDIRHRVLARFVTPDGSAEQGDSGSPIMSTPNGGKLLGMLIAGDQQSYVLAIPAWQLVDPGNYGLDDGPWEFWPQV